LNRVELSTEEFPMPKWAGNLKKFTKKTLAVLEKDKWDVSVVLCGDKTISALNSRYRKKAGPTDILSFDLDETDEFPGGGSRKHGEIIISLDSMRYNTARFNINEDEELRRLLIHGILHLDGMDHGSNDKNEPMLVLQEKVLTQLSNEFIIKKCLLGRKY